MELLPSQDCKHHGEASVSGGSRCIADKVLVAGGVKSYLHGIMEDDDSMRSCRRIPSYQVPNMGGLGWVGTGLGRSSFHAREPKPQQFHRLIRTVGKPGRVVDRACLLPAEVLLSS